MTNRTTGRSQWCVANTENELIAAVRRADAEQQAVHISGGDGPVGFDGVVIRDATTGLSVNADGCDPTGLVYCGAVTASVAAGERWDDLVATAVAEEWVGLEALSGLPGTVGEVAAANPHVFGQSPGDTIAAIHTWDRETHSRRYLAMVYCEFDEDGSRLSRARLADGGPQLVPLKVDFLLKQGDLTTPVRDEALARLLEVNIGARVPIAQVRQRVLESRQ